MIDLKIYNINDYIKDDDKNKDKCYCLALFKYYSEDFNKNMYVLFIRDLNKTKSFYDWKMLDYNYLNFNNLDENKFSIKYSIKI